MSTEVDRKSPMKPSLRRRAISSRPPHIRAATLVYASHVAEYGDSPVTVSPASPAARMAAVAESAPTTSSLLDPSKANTMVGRRIVYRPVWIGVWAMVVYHIVSGIATAANVTPATTSVISHDRW